MELDSRQQISDLKETLIRKSSDFNAELNIKDAKISDLLLQLHDSSDNIAQLQKDFENLVKKSEANEKYLNEQLELKEQQHSNKVDIINREKQADKDALGDVIKQREH